MRISPRPHRSSKPCRTVSIIGTGSYAPERILTNHDLEKMVDTSDQWIRTRTGIRERRIAKDSETTSDMGSRAALAAMEQAKVTPEEIDLIIVATATPDHQFPATACFVQKKIGQRLNTLKMSGKEVYKQAVISMFNAATRVLDEAGLQYEDIDCVIPHQANLRIIEAIAERMALPMDKFYVNLDRFGNTSAAAVAMALDEAHRTGRIQIGDYILLIVFGGGLTWASSVIQW